MSPAALEGRPTPLEERPGIVYKLEFICGDFYKGETGRSPKPCRLAAFERSAVDEHRLAMRLNGTMLKYWTRQQH